MGPSEKERYEIQVRENSIRIVQPHGFLSDTDVNEVISRADKISDFILNGAKEEDISAKTYIGMDGRSFRLYWANTARERVMIVHDDEGVTVSSPAPEPQNVTVKGKIVIQTTSKPWMPPIAVFDDNNVDPYPLVGGDGKHFRIGQDGKGNIIFQYEDGTKNIFPLDFFPEAAGE